MDEESESFQLPFGCIFCCNEPVIKQQTFHPILIARALYSKFNSSLHYFFAKDINDWFQKARTPNIFKIKDQHVYDDFDEFLKQDYSTQECNELIELIVEYYKFHSDVPRLFMMPVVKSLDLWHDKRRKIKYNEVVRMLTGNCDAQMQESQSESTQQNDLTPEMREYYLMKNQNILKDIGSEILSKQPSKINETKQGDNFIDKPQQKKQNKLKEQHINFGDTIQQLNHNFQQIALSSRKASYEKLDSKQENKSKILKLNSQLKKSISGISIGFQNFIQSIPPVQTIISTEFNCFTLEESKQKLQSNQNAFKSMASKQQENILSQNLLYKAQNKMLAFKKAPRILQNKKIFQQLNKDVSLATKLQLELDKQNKVYKVPTNESQTQIKKNFGSQLHSSRQLSSRRQVNQQQLTTTNTQSSITLPKSNLQNVKMKEFYEKIYQINKQSQYQIGSRTERSLGKKQTIEDIYNKKLKTETSNDGIINIKTKYNPFLKKKSQQILHTQAQTRKFKKKRAQSMAKSRSQSKQNINGITIGQNNYKLNESKQDLSRQKQVTDIKRLLTQHLKQTSQNVLGKIKSEAPNQKLFKDLTNSQEKKRLLIETTIFQDNKIKLRPSKSTARLSLHSPQKKEPFIYKKQERKHQKTLSATKPQIRINTDHHQFKQEQKQLQFLENNTQKSQITQYHRKRQSLNLKNSKQQLLNSLHQNAKFQQSELLQKIYNKCKNQLNNCSKIQNTSNKKILRTEASCISKQQGYKIFYCNIQQDLTLNYNQLVSYQIKHKKTKSSDRQFKNFEQQYNSLKKKF